MKIKKIIKNTLKMYYVKEMVFVSPCRKIVIRLSVYVLIFVLSLLFFWIPHVIISRSYFLVEFRQSRFATDLKYVLIWKPTQLKKKILYRQNKLPEGQNVFINQKCPFINCYITYDKELLSDKHQNLDAVVFNVEDIIRYRPEDFYLERSSDQIYIFHSLESSEKYPICNSFFDNFFNWTWTYKLNSDIPHPLVNIYDQKNMLIGPKKNISWIQRMTHNDRLNKSMFNKSRAIAWLIPECRTKVKYQDFINELANEIKGYNHTLDLYGPCGNKKCPKGGAAECHKMIENKYFFQLVLEDSFAEDYFTERMAQVMSHVVIPIILGISDYKSFLPPGSYIDAQSFDMKKIGTIINYLIQYESTYYYFFDWKNHYYYTARSRSRMCDLCTKLNNNNTVSQTVYKNFRKWWNNDFRDACHQMDINQMFFKTD